MDEESKAKIAKLIQNRYLCDIKSGLRARSYCKTTGDFCESFGQILIAATGIVSFASATWNISYLSYIAGSLSTLSISKLSSYCMRESKERSDEVNRILTKLGIDNIVNIAIDSASEQPSLTKIDNPVNAPLLNMMASSTITPTHVTI